MTATLVHRLWKLLLGTAGAIAALVAPLAAQVPAPLDHFGFEPGENRHLADWAELGGYYDAVAAASPRVVIDTLGVTTEGRPFPLLIISSEANQGRLDEIRETNLRLADPRTIGSAEELRRLEAEARTIVLITAHVHSTEVGAGQMPAALLYDLASSDDPEILDILDKTVILLVPSLNPDGTDLVSTWYRRYLDTPFEGSPPVRLYHPYTGHDNNRDWYAFTQVETQMTVEKVHNVWHPMIVHDVHQMGSQGARIFLPPYTDPFERNVDPLIVGAINQLGSYMSADMMMRGFTGMVSASQYDLFTPARSYQHYHGGVRILSETASANLATPVYVEPFDLTGGSDFRPGQATMNYPAPWPGGEWGLRQIVDYQQAAAMALLRNAARNRDFWVENFVAIGRRAVGKWPGWPDFWVLPADQSSMGLEGVLRILTMGSVEVRRAESAFEVDDRDFAAGTYVIRMDQPYASWAQTMLEYQDYPDLRAYPGGPPIRPYDVTAHTLPLLMGVRALPVWGSAPTRLSDPIPQVEAHYPTPAGLTGPEAPRIGMYRGWREPMSAGWTRWLFDQFRIPYTALSDADMRSGALIDRFDVIVLQEQPAADIALGWPEGTVPPEYTGGMGPTGIAALRDFVREGGRLVAIESATDLAIDLFDLPIGNPLTGLPSTEFYVPGAILNLQLEPSSWLAAGLDPSTIAWFWRTSRTFEIRDPRIRVAAHYGVGNPRLSGWVLGSFHLAGRPAIVEADVGRGSVVLFGFQPNYRGHSIATWPLLFNALRGPSALRHTN